MPIDVLGWIAMIMASTLELPQLIRLARTRNVDGLSLVAWQTLLTLAISWTAHGLRIGQPPQVLAQLMTLLTTVPILILLSHHLNRRLLVTFLPAIAAAGVLIFTDHAFGSTVFGMVAILPSLIWNSGQSLKLIRAAHVGGVSAVFVIMAVANQVLWLTWATRVQDPATVIAAATALVITTFNLVWYVLRRRGLRALRPGPGPDIPVAVTPTPIDCGGPLRS